MEHRHPNTGRSEPVASSPPRADKIAALLRRVEDSSARAATCILGIGRIMAVVILDDADQSCRLICMRTTLNLNDALMEEAGRYTGVKEKTALLHEGLRALIQREAAARLAALGGKDPKAVSAPRRKPANRS
jgi:Arc/MetJ family transcription regulator